jgi:hypothetical protein
LSLRSRDDAPDGRPPQRSQGRLGEVERRTRRCAGAERERAELLVAGVDLSALTGGQLQRFEALALASPSGGIIRLRGDPCILVSRGRAEDCLRAIELRLAPPRECG